MQNSDFREFGNITVKANSKILEKITMDMLSKHLTIGLSPLIHKLKTSKPKQVHRLSSEKMSDIIRESKRMIFENSSIVATAKAQTSKMFKPKTEIIIRNESKNLNHLHAVKVVVHQRV